MFPEKPFSTKIAMGALTGLLGLVATLGNGPLLAVVARFRSLRTFPNILITNLAAVDLFNAAINLPLYTIYASFQASWFRGKTLAIVTSSFDRLYLFANLASMLALLLNVYCAIEFDFKYFAWKTKTKAFVCACLIWFIGTVMVVFSSIPLYDIGLGDARVAEYREEYYMGTKYFVTSFMALLIILGSVVGFLAIRSIKKRKKKRVEMNLSALQAEARLQSDIKATKTIAITVAAYFISYVPVILYAVLSRQPENLADSWFAFITWYAMFFSSAVNPFIYYLRTNRFRSALKQFIKDPFGSGDFKEKPRGRGKGIGKGNLDGAVGESENQAKYRGERRNEIKALSMPPPQAQMYVFEAGTNSIDEKGNPHPVNANAFSVMIECGQGYVEKNGMIAINTTKREPCKGTEAATSEVNKDASNKSGLVNESGKGEVTLASTRKKVRPLCIVESLESRNQAQNEGECTHEKEIKEVLEERRNSIIPVISI